MLKSITRTLLTSTMGFAWDIISTGERGITRSEALGVTDPEKRYAGGVEKMTYQTRMAMVRVGEGLEMFLNWCGVKLGYSDGEVSGMVAWPVQAH
jgi:hypothetical protein